MAILICLVITFSLTNLHAQENEFSLFEITPEDPMLILQIKDIDEPFELIENSKAWQYLIEAPIWEIFIEELEIETKIKGAERLIRPCLPILSHLLGKEIMLIVPKFEGIVEFCPTVLVQLDRSDYLGEILTTAIEVLLDNIPETVQREYSGYSYKLIKSSKLNMYFACGVFDNFLVVSLGETMLFKIIDLNQGRSMNSLANNAKFLQRIEYLKSSSAKRVTNFQTMFYIDFEKIFNFTQLIYPIVRNLIHEERQLLVDEVVKQLDLVQWIAGISNLTRDGLISQEYIEFNPNTTNRDLIAMLQVPPTTFKSINFVGADSASYFASNLIEISKLWDIARNIKKPTWLGKNGHEVDIVEELQKKNNINLKEELFAFMDKKIAVIHVDDSIPVPIEKFGKEKMSEYLYMVKTKDSGKVAKSLGRLENLVAEVLGVMEDRPIKWETIDHLNTQIHTIAIPDSMLKVCYSVTDEYLLFAMHPSILKASIDCAKGHTENLSTNPQFRELRVVTPEKVNYIRYTNIARILNSLFTEKLTETGANNIALMKPIFDQSIDLVKALTESLVGSIVYTVKDGNGLRTYSLLKVRDINECLPHKDRLEAKLARSLCIANMYSKKEMLDHALPYLDCIMKNANELLSEHSLLEIKRRKNRNHYRETALVYEALGSAYQLQNKLDEAIAQYQKAINIDPNLSEVHYNLACVYSLRKEKELAIDCLRTAVTQNKYWLSYCQTDSDFDNIRGSEEFLQIVKSLPQESEENQKQNRWQLNSFILHELFYRMCIVLNLNDAEAYYRLGLIYDIQGILDKAIIAYEKAISLDPNYRHAYRNLGLIYRKRHKSEKAIVAYNEAILFNPSDPVTYAELAIVYYEKNKLDDAIELYKKAVNIEPNFSYAHYNLACVYSIQNERKLAMKHLQIAITQNRYWIEQCKKDSDFENIREIPEFQELVK